MGEMLDGHKNNLGEHGGLECQSSGQEAREYKPHWR